MIFSLLSLCLVLALGFVFVAGRWYERSRCQDTVIQYRAVIEHAAGTDAGSQDERDAMVTVITMLDSLAESIARGSRPPSYHEVT